MTKALVLFSGGIDSTTALAWAMIRGYRCTGLFLACEQPQVQQEAKAVREISEFYGVDVLVDDVKLHYASDPDDHWVIPFRNGIFLAHACNVGMERKFDYVVHGMYSQPGWGFEYPDSTPEFLGTFSALPKVYGSNLRILSPFSGLTKNDVVQIAQGFNVPIHLTWTCYNPQEGGKPCGECPACIKRQEALDAIRDQ